MQTVTSYITSSTTKYTISTVTLAVVTSTAATLTKTVTTTVTPPVIAPTCTTVVTNSPDGPDYDVSYTLYYQGTCVIENTNNGGNSDPANSPPLYSNITGSYDNPCDAIQQCAQLITTNPYTVLFDPEVWYSFDVHYVQSNASWVCVQYYTQNTDVSAFNVPSDDVLLTYGFNIGRGQS